MVSNCIVCNCPTLSLSTSELMEKTLERKARIKKNSLLIKNIYLFI